MLLVAILAKAKKSIHGIYVRIHPEERTVLLLVLCMGSDHICT